MGTNIIAGTEPKNILNVFYEILEGKNPNAAIPPLWDGKSGKRIAKIIDATFG